MNKKDLINSLYKKLQDDDIVYPKWELEQIIDALFESMKDTLQEGEEIFIGHFGRFEIKERKERRYRNPITKEMATMPSSQTVTFKPSGELLGSHKDNVENTVKLTP